VVYAADDGPGTDPVFQCKNCGNGVGTRSGRGKPSQCGDPYQTVSPDSQVWMRSPSVVATYVEGATIDIELCLTANHGGRHAFRVCQDTSPACDNSTDWLIGSVTGRRYWYIPYIGGGDDPTSWWTQRYSARFDLPEGVSCPNGCILQWIWWASQTCAMPCEPELGAQEDMTQCGKNRWRRVCDVSNPQWEEFRNCADIVIASKPQSNIAAWELCGDANGPFNHRDCEDGLECHEIVSWLWMCIPRVA
jgi:hypothetical protein